MKITFLNGNLQEEVFKGQLEGFVVAGQENKVYKLNKTLYGLKQTPRVLYDKVDYYLKEQGLVKNNANYNLYYSIHDGKLMILVFWVVAS